MHLVGLYTYCRMIHGAYSVKLIGSNCSVTVVCVNVVVLKIYESG